MDRPKRFDTGPALAYTTRVMSHLAHHQAQRGHAHSPVLAPLATACASAPVCMWRDTHLTTDDMVVFVSSICTKGDTG